MSNSDLSRKSWLAYYGEFMQSCLRRFGGAADAEDVAHDAVEALLRKDQKTLTAAHARNFLYKSARHRAIDLWRRNSRFQHLAWDELHEDAHPITDGADAQASAEQVRHALVAALEALPLNHRRAFVLNRLEGWTQPEIARHLKLSIASVERYIALASQFIRERLRDEF